ncbi:MAG: hypothetical protein JWM97_411 [Phycisphaerales bacterium]|jgi:hypothetical protein|nr:hypothetical protein [Phycisphaerales bacterium]MDB5302862.1 hypothetical protein [Phycisphaerales bacterium]
MRNLIGLGLHRVSGVRSSGPSIEHVLTRRPLQRVLAFRGRSIDDVVNDPIIKNEIYGYWKLNKQIERTGEITDLERQWNHLGRRG